MVRKGRQEYDNRVLGRLILSLSRRLFVRGNDLKWFWSRGLGRVVCTPMLKVGVQANTFSYNSRSNVTTVPHMKIVLR